MKLNNLSVLELGRYDEEAGSDIPSSDDEHYSRLYTVNDDRNRYCFRSRSTG